MKPNAASELNIEQIMDAAYLDWLFRYVHDLHSADQAVKPFLEIKEHHGAPCTLSLNAWASINLDGWRSKDAKRMARLHFQVSDMQRKLWIAS